MSDTDAKDFKVQISYKPLRELLMAAMHGGVEMREIQALTGSAVEKMTGKKTCLTLVIEEFNEQIEARNNRSSEDKPADQPVDEEQTPPTSEQPAGMEHLEDVLVSFVLDPFAPDKAISGETCLYSNVALGFGEIDLRGFICNNFADDFMSLRVSPIGVFDSNLEAIGILMEVTTDSGAEVFNLPIPGGKLIPVNDNPSGAAFNTTMRFRDRLFTLEAYIGFDPKTGMLHAVAANLNTDVSLQRLGTSLGLTENVVEGIRAKGLYVRGALHTKRNKEDAKIS